MHFSSEWGLPDPSTSGSRWREFEGDDVESEIRRRAGAPDISKAQSESERLRKLVQVRRNDVISILRAASSDVADTLLHDLLEEAERICSRTAEDLVSLMRPSKEQVVRDMIAYNQGWRTAYSGEVDHRFRREVDQSRRVKRGLQTS
jgi:hypothetical protein